MTSYLKNWIEKDDILDDLASYNEEAQFESLESISPENFSDMIFVSDFYLSKPKFKNLFIEKIKKIKNWKVYFDHDAPITFIDVFFVNAKFDITDQELAIYYLSSYKLPLDIFAKHFLKIYQYALIDNKMSRQDLKEKSVVYNGVFIAYSNFEIVRVFDFLMDRVERYETQEQQLDNPYSDVLLILIGFIRESGQPISLPQKRLERLYEVSK